MSRFLPKVKHISNDLHLGVLSLDKHLDCLEIIIICKVSYCFQLMIIILIIWGN